MPALLVGEINGSIRWLLTFHKYISLHIIIAWQTSTVSLAKPHLKTSTFVLWNYPDVEIALYLIMKVSESFFQAYVTQDLFLKFIKPVNTLKLIVIHFHLRNKSSILECKHKHKQDIISEETLTWEAIPESGSYA